MLQKSRKSMVASSLVLLAASTLALGDARASESAISLTHNSAQLKWGPCPAFMPKGCEIAILHGDPAKPNVDVFFKLPPGSTAPQHTHTSAERMVLVSGELEVTYAGQSPIKLKPGAYAYGPAGKPHQATCAKAAACVLFIAFESPLDAIPAGTAGITQ
ncbi:MAG: cupin domain-containing protein [Panacagrimonas sp.]